MASRTILVVEDDDDIREMLQMLLKDEGYRAHSARDGQEALNHLRGGEIHPDLILLDYMMPVMDGEGFLQAAGADPRLAAIPVLLLSAAPSGMQVPVAATIRKPLDLDQLLETVKQLVGA